MLIGYVRVSKSDGTQTLAPQRDAMLAAGVDPTRIYEDLASGRHDARPGLIACLKAIQPGNTLVLWKLDRLGRDLRHLVNTVEDLRTRGVGLKALKRFSEAFQSGPPVLLPSLLASWTGREAPMVTLLIAVGALLVAVVVGVPRGGYAQARDRRA